MVPWQFRRNPISGMQYTQQFRENDSKRYSGNQTGQVELNDNLNEKPQDSKSQSNK
jgi:hypothetical protein